MEIEVMLRKGSHDDTRLKKLFAFLKSRKRPEATKRGHFSVNEDKLPISCRIPFFRAQALSNFVQKSDTASGGEDELGVAHVTWKQSLD